MNSITFILITVISSLLAGLTLAIINLYAIEPLIDEAINIEIKNSDNEIDLTNLSSQRDIQKSYSTVEYSLLGLGFGMIFGVVFALTHKFIPLSDDRKKAILVALILCLTLYVIPFIKSPALPPDANVTEIKYMKENTYLEYQIVSILITSIIAIIYYRIKNIQHLPYILITCYVFVIIGIFMVFPLNKYDIPIPMDLVNSFQIATLSSMVAFWIILGIVFGLFWNRLKQFSLLN